MISLVKTILKFKTKEEALKLHLFAIAMEERIKLSISDIDVIVEIHKQGYDQTLFQKCVNLGYYKSEQTVRNSVARCTKQGILLKTRGHRQINPKFLPEIKGDYIFHYQVSYDNIES